MILEVDGHDRVKDPAAGEVCRRLAAPEDAATGLDRVDVAPTPAGATHEHGVDESGENLAPVIGGEG